MKPSTSYSRHVLLLMGRVLSDAAAVALQVPLRTFAR
jgi:hypothetical protein